jgi:hypothetical protein
MFGGRWWILQSRDNHGVHSTSKLMYGLTMLPFSGTPAGLFLVVAGLSCPVGAYMRTVLTAFEVGLCGQV